MNNSIKFFTLILLVYFLNLSITLSQKTIDENKVWTIRSGDFTPNYHTFALKFSGDTLIDNISYKKLMHTFDSSLVNDWHRSNIFMREDSLHRVYKYTPLNEVLIYDFSLQLGDTFAVTDHIIPNSCFLVVKRVDSVVMNNGELRKRISFLRSNDPNPSQVWGDIHWIQGIGTLSNLFENYWDCYADNQYDLLCYIENEMHLYSPRVFSPCFVTPTAEVRNKEIEIYPNPSSGIFHIESESQIESIFIIDFTGKEMRIEPQNNEINLDKWQNGIFLLRIRFANNEEIRKRIIKME